MAENVMKQNEYTWSAKYYDKLCNEHFVLEDFAFYKEFINKESSVLELGYGRKSVESYPALSAIYSADETPNQYIYILLDYTD